MHAPGELLAFHRPDETAVSRPRPPLRYFTAGEGPPVLFIQGPGLPRERWRDQIEALGDRYQTITFDHRGPLNRAVRFSPASPEALAVDLLAVLDEEDLEAVHLVARGTGAGIAQRLAVIAPQRVKSVSLLGSFTAGDEEAAAALADMATLVVSAPPHASAAVNRLLDEHLQRVERAQAGPRPEALEDRLERYRVELARLLAERGAPAPTPAAMLG